MAGKYIDFTSTVSAYRDGALIPELNETFSATVKACIDTNKAGEVTLKFKIEPQTHADGVKQIKLTPKVESKNPRFESGVGFFYVVTDENEDPVGLERQDPRQMTLMAEIETGSKV